MSPCEDGANREPALSPALSHIEELPEGIALGSKKTRRLDMVVAAVQRRWGPKALRRGASAPASSATTAEIPHIPTGFPALDQALSIADCGLWIADAAPASVPNPKSAIRNPQSGGLPRGRITEVLGAPTSGMVTLALRVVANAQATGDTAAYVDLGHTFDPDYAARCGVAPERLLLVRPHSGREALEITHELVASGGTGVLVFDAVSHLLGEPLGAQTMSAALRRITGPLAASPCALIFLTPLYFGDAASMHNYPSGFALPHYAAVRLLIEKERWLHRRRDIRGYQARVTVLKNKLGAAGQQVTIAITFNGVVEGNGT